MSTSIQKLYEHGKNLQDRLKRVRAKEREATNGMILRAGTAGSTLAGQLAAAAIDGKWGGDSAGEQNGIASIGPVPINAALGLIAIVSAIPGVLPGSEYLCTAGAGMLSYPCAKTLEAKIRERSAK